MGDHRHSRGNSYCLADIGMNIILHVYEAHVEGRPIDDVAKLGSLGVHASLLFEVPGSYTCGQCRMSLSTASTMTVYSLYRNL